MYLLKTEVFHELRAVLNAGLRPTAAQQAEFMAARGRPQQGGDAPDNYAVAGDTAQISVNGVLTPRPNFLLWLMGYEQTSYADIQRSLAMAASDAKVARVAMVVDSPGGTVDGLFDTIAAIEAFNKPIAVSASCACSAAYAIAAAAGPITATNAAAEFGSIGVAASVALDDDTVDITSTEAPNKRPNAGTPEGQAVIREHLDAIHELFAGAIASGRSTTVANVNANYGRGGTLLAGAAKQRGMVDAIAAKPKRSTTSSRGNASANPGPMTRAALDAFEHPQPAPGESLTQFAERSLREVDARAAATDDRDLGDRVADLLDAQLDAAAAKFGGKRRKVQAVYSVAPTIQMPARSKPRALGFDMGDAVVALMDAQKNGTKPPTFELPELEPTPESTGPDLVDQIADLMAAQRPFKQASASR